MTAWSAADGAATLAQRIGRYFGLVSWLPSLALVLWVYALIAVRSWQGAIDWTALTASFAHWSVSKAVAVGAASLAAALLLHPLQFAMTQILEGYWGTSRLARSAMSARVRHYRERQRRLVRLAAALDEAVSAEADAHFAGRFAAHGRDGNDPGTWSDELYARNVVALLNSEGGDRLVPLMTSLSAAERAADAYPAEPRRIMPTRLGNALRKFEAEAGAQYGLDAVRIYPHLQLIAPPEHLAYVSDAREEMDTAVRLCVTFLLATAFAVGLLLRDGWSLLWALAPYVLAYLSYRGAVSSAQGYGVVVGTLIDVDRFLLYERLHLPFPRNTDDERRRNAQLTSLIAGDTEQRMTYRRSRH